VGALDLGAPALALFEVKLDSPLLVGEAHPSG
jgi:hypothetical protein